MTEYAGIHRSSESMKRRGGRPRTTWGVYQGERYTYHTGDDLDHRCGIMAICEQGTRPAAEIFAMLAPDLVDAICGSDIDPTDRIQCELLKILIDNPDDTVTQLVLADRLDDLGDSGGESIRQAVEAKQREDDDDPEEDWQYCPGCSSFVEDEECRRCPICGGKGVIGGGS